MSHSLLAFFAVLGLLSTVTFAAPPAAGEGVDCHVYIGTFSSAGSKGIYLFNLDAAAGTLTAQGVAAEEKDPNFLAASPDGKTLFAVASKNGAGAVDAFSVDPATGKLTRINQQSTGGNNAVYVSLDPAGKTAFVANYDGPSVASFAISKDGSLGEAAVVKHEGTGPNAGRQNRAYPHSILADPAGKFVFSPDLGCDKVFISKLDATKSTLVPNDPPAFITPPGSGPRHMAFRPDAKFAYVTTEMASEILTCTYDAEQGVLKQIAATSIRPEKNNAWASGAEIKVHPTGKFLYASVRGANTIAVFAIDAATGKLTLVEQQPARVKTPRGFNIDPSGTFLIAAGQDSNSISLFKIAPDTGALTPAGEPISTPCPVSVAFVRKAP